MIVVMGRWPRSGTSLLMAMLAAGGLNPLRDDDQSTSDQYPVGAFQHSGVLTGRTVETLAAADMGARACVKMFPRHLRDLSDVGVYPAKVLVVSRPYEECAASWDAAFPGRSRDHDREGVNTAADVALALLAEADVPVLGVDFHVLVDDPHGESQRIAVFVGGGLDVKAMAAVPDPAHRHFGEPAL